MPKSNFSYVSKVIGSGKKFRSLSSSAKFFHGKSRQDEDESRKCQTECSKTTMYRRPHFAKYLQNTPRPLQSDLSMDKCASNKRPTTLQKRAMTSNDLLRGGRVPIGRGSNKDLVPSPGSLSSEGLKRSFFLLMRSMEKDDQLDDNTDARMLFNAIRKGKIRLAKFILDAAPVDLVNCSDFKGKTPLIIACSLKEELSRDLMVDLLLNYDADVNLCDDDGRTPLSHACEKRCNDIIDILVKQANVDPDIPDSQGNTALIYCSMVGNDVGIDILTRHFRRLGLNVDHVNSEGLTALLLASKQGNITCAKLLIEQGHASLLRRDKKEGFTAQEWLLYNGFTWDDIAPLTTRVKSRARFVRAINVARIASFQSARKVSEDALRIPIGMKCAHKKATFPEGKRSKNDVKTPLRNDSGTDTADAKFVRRVSRGKQPLHQKMRLPKIQVTNPHKKNFDFEVQGHTSTSEEDDSEEENSEEEDVVPKGFSYRSHFGKTRSQTTLEEVLPYDSA